MKRFLVLLSLVLIGRPFGVFASLHEGQQDIIVAQNYIWSLTNEGKISLYNTNNGKPAEVKITNTNKIQILAKDASGIPVIADQGHDIKRYQASANTWEKIGSFDGNISGMVFDNKNRCYLISTKGILDLSTGKNYFSNQGNNYERTITDKWNEPSAYFIDRKDNIWIGFDYGEWGGDALVFNTLKNEFIVPDFKKVSISSYPVQCFFEDSTAVYVSTSLMHFEISGSLIKFENLSAKYVLETTYHRKDSTKTFYEEGNLIEGEYIGPGAYNNYNHSIYFYSQNGIFKGAKSKDLSKMENWQLVVKPDLTWTAGQAKAVGDALNVLKLIILDKDKFVFLSENNGIGFYDGKVLEMIK